MASEDESNPHVSLAHVRKKAMKSREGSSLLQLLNFFSLLLAIPMLVAYMNILRHTTELMHHHDFIRAEIFMELLILSAWVTGILASYLHARCLNWAHMLSLLLLLAMLIHLALLRTYNHAIALKDNLPQSDYYLPSLLQSCNPLQVATKDKVQGSSVCLDPPSSTHEKIFLLNHTKKDVHKVVLLSLISIHVIYAISKCCHYMVHIMKPIYLNYYKRS
ncbi:hypothetical protein GOP47_0000417 [Adiantum capillus-veneris]|uniref:Uncharacterized protein n=1 Tax=Adiantum capillus-veneris TaxID=13818 RepID=A0A9D4ZQQ0_ADICA|nr:hypothetical protein GOP47_0000417 [Adiantum capillus-veneris]